MNHKENGDNAMYQTIITDREAGQRFDKYLHRILPGAGNSFLYKMLRKKNITLNGKKADGREKTAAGDSVAIYFSDETLAKFMDRGIGGDTARAAYVAEDAVKCGMDEAAEYLSAYHRLPEVRILYENDHILLADKPVGVLSQKAAKKDISLNEWLIGYLLHKGDVTADDLIIYKPSVCNRLDRNTSGIVLCAKSLKGAQMLSELLKNRTLHKYYQLYVKGCIYEAHMIEGFLVKDERHNKVTVIPAVSPDMSTGRHAGGTEQGSEGAYIRTAYRPLKPEGDKTLLEVELMTGKTHQIRAHLASIGHPLLGDYKYGDKAWNDIYQKKYHISSQLLHAYKVVFPQLEEPFADISGRTFYAELPDLFRQVSGQAEPCVKP